MTKEQALELTIDDWVTCTGVSVAIDEMQPLLDGKPRQITYIGEEVGAIKQLAVHGEGKEKAEILESVYLTLKGIKDAWAYGLKYLEKALTHQEYANKYNVFVYTDKDKKTHASVTEPKRGYSAWHTNSLKLRINKVVPFEGSWEASLYSPNKAFIAKGKNKMTGKEYAIENDCYVAKDADETVWSYAYEPYIDGQEWVARKDAFPIFLNKPGVELISEMTCNWKDSLCSPYVEFIEGDDVQVRDYNYEEWKNTKFLYDFGENCNRRYECVNLHHIKDYKDNKHFRRTPWMQVRRAPKEAYKPFEKFTNAMINTKLVNNVTNHTHIIVGVLHTGWIVIRREDGKQCIEKNFQELMEEFTKDGKPFGERIQDEPAISRIKKEG